MPKAQPIRRRSASNDSGNAKAPTSIDTYRSRRDFAATTEPAPSKRRGRQSAPIFVVQKHAARRLHWDFRLEHGGVLWSWAVPKGPSLDPADKRLAVRTEDHPLAYADFAGTIPQGHYGAGTVETWDRGTWKPVEEPAAALAAGTLKFALHGDRLRGGFMLVRLKPKPRDRAENWLLIKEHDTEEKPDADAAALEKRTPRRKAGSKADTAPAAGARRAALPRDPGFQLAALAEAAPRTGHWLLEIKFDGYRLGARKAGDSVRLVSRGGQDWTARLPRLAAAIARLPAADALLDGELVAEDDKGFSRFPLIQQAFSDGDDSGLRFYAFDLLHRDGWDLRDCRLADRKAALAELVGGRGTVRLSEHQHGDAAPLFREACAMGLEGIVCKDADAPYRAGRGHAWVKLKCQGREEFVVLGWTPPAGSRTGIGALHMGYHDESGALHYAGGVGTGFDAPMLALLRKRLDALKATAPRGLRHAGDKPPATIRWVEPALVAEIRYGGWSGAGRLRHASFLGLREDKPARAVVRPVADPEAARQPGDEAQAQIVRPRAAAAKTAGAGSRIVVAKAPVRGGTPRQVGGVRLTHPDRALWPGITKQALADYWLAVATHALPGIARRPLALVRCPDGIDGEHFFQKHRSPGMPDQIRDGTGAFVAIDDADGLVACAQMAAIELHSWGATEDDPDHPDQLVFDLDPGEGVAFAAVMDAAHDVRERLAALGLDSFCRTTGGHGLHVVVPLKAAADWNAARAFCRAFAETMTRDSPDRYLATLSKARRRGLILVDWLRNGEGATAVASFSPRARPGAMVAMPVAWRAVTKTLDPAAFTIATVPGLLQRRRADPWAGFTAAARPLPVLGAGVLGAGVLGAGVLGADVGDSKRKRR